jgi:hypothetical protein
MHILASQHKEFGIDVVKLKSQVMVMQETLTNNNVKTGLDVLSTLLSFKTGDKFPFQDLYPFVLLVLTLPVSSAQAERTFSTMKRVKNYLRTSMGDQRLSDLCTLSLEQEASFNLLQQPDRVVDEFAEMANRRVLLR